MAEKSGFFDAHLVNGEYDRVYLAESFAKYFASFIGNGVFGGKSNELMVQQNSTASMSIKVLPGLAWINGYWYENDNELLMPIDTADGVLNRIDLVVLRWDNLERVIRLVIKKGVPASKPVAPNIQREDDYYELRLAQIYVKAGITKITQAEIFDSRLYDEYCGFVHGLIEQFDTTHFGEQIDSFIEQFETSSTEKMQAAIDRINSLVKADMVAGLVSDVDNLKQLTIEDETEIGCFYRINLATNEKEWVNPPNKFGHEYCTTERWNGKPVYQKTFYVASLPNKSAMSFDIGSEWDKIVSVSGYAHDEDDLTFYPFPIIPYNQVIPIAVINNISSDGYLSVVTNADASHFQAYITVKYVKA